MERSDITCTVHHSRGNIDNPAGFERKFAEQIELKRQKAIYPGVSKQYQLQRDTLCSIKDCPTINDMLMNFFVIKSLQL